MTERADNRPLGGPDSRLFAGLDYQQLGAKHAEINRYGGHDLLGKQSSAYL